MGPIPSNGKLDDVVHDGPHHGGRNEEGRIATSSFECSQEHRRDDHNHQQCWRGSELGHKLRARNKIRVAEIESVHSCRSAVVERDQRTVGEHLQQHEAKWKHDEGDGGERKPSSNSGDTSS